MENKKQNKIADEIIEKIKKGEVKMLPKSYFLMKSVLYAVVSIFAVIFATFFIALVFYVLKINGFLNLSQFGLKGLRDFILSLPVLLLAVAILFIVVAIMFLSEYPATYRRPLIYSVGSLLVIFSLGLLCITKAVSFRRMVYNEIESGEVPVISDFYDYIKETNPRNVLKGRVENVYSSSFLMDVGDGENVRVVYGPQTSFYFEELIRSGDYVIVHGRRNGNSIGAFVVEKVEE
ncbi:MAG: hypothetical protein PHZ25_00055 [Candidatus Pacebacteria bacterium]|nr:hypothetical protein [Candidatus Paceibacterota bacterium]